MDARESSTDSLDNWSFDPCDWSFHVTISDNYNVHGDNFQRDMIIHTDGPAPWNKEELNGGRLGSFIGD